MTPDWGSLPLLPLRCVLDHLSMEDAQAAMSTCRQWHAAIWLYEGRKETLKLRARYFDKNMFLTRIFRKHARKLHIYIDCLDKDLEKFNNYILPQFFETQNLQELIFIGPNYIQQTRMPAVKLNRIIIESLIYKHLHTIQKLAFFGCEMEVVRNMNEKNTNKNVVFYSKLLSFNKLPTRADRVLTKSNANLMEFSALQHIIVDYNQINTESLETLSELTMFTRLSINVCNKRVERPHEPIDWHRLNVLYQNRLKVSVNIIALPYRKFNEVIENLLVEGLMLISLKVMFCKTLYTPLINHITCLYRATLRELVWADGPYESTDAYARIIKPQVSQQEFDNVNPFMMLCWQCVHLRRLVIHGYWVWQYDLLGFVRLCKSLSRLEVSAIYKNQNKFRGMELSRESAVRVLMGDTPSVVDHEYIDEVNEYMDYKWKPTPWGKLHPALRARSSSEHRAGYIVHEVNQSLGVT